MPITLSAQLVLTMNRKLASKCAFFREVSNACMVSLMSAMEPLVFVPQQLVVFEGHALTEVYFINRGHIQLIERTVHIVILRDNDNFGLDDFMSSCLTGNPPIVKHTARAVTYCDVMTISLTKLNEVLAQDETFQQRMRTGELGRRNPDGLRNRKGAFFQRQVTKMYRAGAGGRLEEDIIELPPESDEAANGGEGGAPGGKSARETRTTQKGATRRTRGMAERSETPTTRSSASSAVSSGAGAGVGAGVGVGPRASGAGTPKAAQAVEADAFDA